MMTAQLVSCWLEDDETLQIDQVKLFWLKK